MDPEYTQDKLPDKLTQRLQATCGVRRRAVLTNGNGQWELVCCTVEGFLPGENIPEPVPQRQYRQAILYEDFLTGEECLSFATELQEGHARFGNINLQRGQTQQWTTELVSVNNDYMTRAGCVISLRFGQHGTRASVRTLLAPDQPYYPDISDATRDWLPFPMYHGDSDARNDQIFFLLPETRAFIASAVFSEKGTLDITVAGTEIDTLSLLIKGAYWEEKQSILHFDARVSESKAALALPADASRFEYYLIDHTGTVYDFHREDRFSRLRTDGSTFGSVKRTLIEQVREASYDGEGLHVEFKPFVEPEQKLGTDRHKTKLREIVTTVVAFANTDGGHIYLGVNDDCSVMGIEQELCAWANAPINDATIKRYLGALKSKIKDIVHGEVTLCLSHARIDGVFVAIVEVPPAASKPVTIRQDDHLYMRTGSSNRKVPPDQWKSILDDKQARRLPLE